MESANDLTPKISIIVPAMLGFDSVLAALDSWDAQTCGGQLEIISRPGHGTRLVARVPVKAER